jgi:hypothetical protein
VPKPHRKIPRPPPGDVTVRKPDGQEVVVDHEQFVERREQEARRREQEAWRREMPRARSPLADEQGADEFEMWDRQRFLALREGDVVTLWGGALSDQWWFVRDVNGLTDEITVCTAILDKPRERTVSFDEVLIESLDNDPDRQHEAIAEYAKLKARLGPARHAA